MYWRQSVVNLQLVYPVYSLCCVGIVNEPRMILKSMNSDSRLLSLLSEYFAVNDQFEIID